MGAVAVISILDENHMNAHICALMPSGRRLREITISLITACLFRYRPRSSLHRRTAACWRKSSASKLNQLHMKAKQSSGKKGRIWIFYLLQSWPFKLSDVLNSTVWFDIVFTWLSPFLLIISCRTLRTSHAVLKKNGSGKGMRIYCKATPPSLRFFILSFLNARYYKVIKLCLLFPGTTWTWWSLRIPKPHVEKQWPIHPPLPASAQKQLWPTFYNSLAIWRLAAQNIRTESMTVLSPGPCLRGKTCVGSV